MKACEKRLSTLFPNLDLSQLEDDVAICWDGEYRGFKAGWREALKWVEELFQEWPHDTAEDRFRIRRAIHEELKDEGI